MNLTLSLRQSISPHYPWFLVAGKPAPSSLTLSFLRAGFPARVPHSSKCAFTALLRQHEGSYRKNNSWHICTDILTIDCYKLELELIHFDENTDTKEKVSGKQHPKLYWITSVQMIAHSFFFYPSQISRF